jgi:hypothetical protein
MASFAPGFTAGRLPEAGCKIAVNAEIAAAERIGSLLDDPAVSVVRPLTDSLVHVVKPCPDLL